MPLLTTPVLKTISSSGLDTLERGRQGDVESVHDASSLDEAGDNMSRHSLSPSNIEPAPIRSSRPGSSLQICSSDGTSRERLKPFRVFATLQYAFWRS